MNQRLITERMKLGLTQAEAAEKIRIGRYTLQRMEQAEPGKLPYPSTARKVSEFYRVPIAELFALDAVESAERVA